MPRLQLTIAFETRLYNLIKGTIKHITFTPNYMIITTEIDNYKVYYNEIHN